MKHIRTKILRTSLVLLATVCLSVGGIGIARAEEPGENFLKQLRAHRYFDMALAYLDRIEAGAPATDELRQSVDLERAQTYLESAAASRMPKERKEFYDKGEAALRNFIKEHAKHARVGEAKLQLGNLLLIRGLTLTSTADADDQAKAEARKSFDAAAVVYDEIVEEMRTKLKAIQGNKTDSGDATQLAMRDRYRGEFLSGILRGGEVRERAADTLPEKSPERKKRYDDALAKYKELASKYGDMLPGAQASFYIGRVQEKKGDADAALKTYQDTMKLPEADLLRPQKTEAAARAINLLLGKSPPQADAAVKFGRSWMDAMRPNERNDPGWQALGTALARAYFQQASGQKPAEAKKSTNMARSLATSASKVPGDHVEQARSLLAEIGEDVQQNAPEEVPEPKSYSDALATARELFEVVDVAKLPIENLNKQIESGTGDQAKLKQQLAQAEAEIEKTRAKISGVLQRGFALITSEDASDSLNQGRYLLALIESQRQRYWDAIVVGEFVAHHYPSDPLALQSGLIALASYQSLMQSADDASRPAVLKKIRPLATFLTKQWPDDPNSSVAASLLVQIAMLEQDWNQAEKSLQQLPDDNPAKAKLFNLLGLSLWSVYQKQSEDSGNADAKATHDQAVKNIQAGLKSVRSDDVDGNTLLGALLVAKSDLDAGKAKVALDSLNNPVYGPLQRSKGKQPVSLPQGLMPDAYRTALSALFAQLKDGGAAEKLLPQAESLLSDMRASLKAEPEGDKKLIGIYFALAKDVRAQIDQAPQAKQKELIELFSLLLNNLSEQSTDVDTIHWVAQTFIQLGESAMGNAEPPAAGQAKDLLTGAAKQLQALLDKNIEDENSRRAIRYELATTSRLLGEYKAAIDQLDEILKEKNTMIDAQEAAALCYQKWALSPGFKPQFIKAALNSAISGARPNKGKNNIWGWAKLASLTQEKDAFEEKFFEARYRIAECLYETGQRAPGENKAKAAARAEKVILDTRAVYPDLGGPANVARNDLLFRKLQQAQNVPVTGLPKPDAK